MPRSETNPHFDFKPPQQREGQPHVDPEEASLQRRTQQNQPLGPYGSQGIRHQGGRSKPQRFQGAELQVDGTSQTPQKRSSTRKEQRPQPPAHEPQRGEQQGDGTRKQSAPHKELHPLPPAAHGGFETPWFQIPREGQRDHAPQRGRKFQSAWIPPQQSINDHHSPYPSEPHKDKHPQEADNANVTPPQNQEQDHYPLHPHDPHQSSGLQTSAPQQDPNPRRSRDPHQSTGLRTSAPEQTRAITWLAAVLCAIFWIVIFLGGLIVLIVYLVYRPRSPRFELSAATLNAAYIDAGSLLNADITLLANFTNPNKKVAVDFNNLIVDLYYGSTLIATQYIDSFSTQSATSNFETVHMVTSQVRLPFGESVKLQEQMSRNEIRFDLKGVFRVRSNLGSFLRYSYRLYSHCGILVAAPPNGALRAVSCRTKR